MKLKRENGWWVGEMVAIPDEVAEAWNQVIVWPPDSMAQAGWPVAASVSPSTGEQDG